MSRVVAGFFVAAMVLSLSACSIQRLPSADEDPGISEAVIGYRTDTEAERLCKESGAEELYHACGRLAGYIWTAVYGIDLTQPDPEDFWLMVAMATYGAYPERLSEFGTIDLKSPEIKDIASTFFPDLDLGDGLPTARDSYAAEYVAAEGLYELQPMAVSHVEYELVSVEALDSDGSCSMRIRLTDTHNGKGESEWVVLFKKWEDGKAHIFPSRVLRLWEDSEVTP
jgi:hypothetical protein